MVLDINCAGDGDEQFCTLNVSDGQMVNVTEACLEIVSWMMELHGMYRREMGLMAIIVLGMDTYRGLIWWWK